jgi:chromosome segregation ATPase
VKRTNPESEPLAVLPQPATRPAPRATEGTGELANIPYRQGAQRDQRAFNTDDVPAHTLYRQPKRQISTLAEIGELLTDIKSQIQTAHDDFEDRKASVEQEAKELQELREQIAELERQKLVLENKVAEIERRGTPVAQLVERAVRIEALVQSAGRLLFERRIEDSSQKLIGVPAVRLHATVRKSLEAAFDHLKRFTTGFYVKLGRANDKSEALAQETLDRCWNDAEALEKEIQ